MATREKALNEFRHRLNNALVDWIPVGGSSLVVDWHERERTMEVQLDCPVIGFRAIYLIRRGFYDHDNMAQLVANHLHELYYSTIN